MAPHPLNHSTLQWHPAMAPSNGTTSTAPCNGILVPRPMRKSGSSPSAPIGSKNPYSYRYLGNNGNVQWHPAMAPRPLHPAMAPWCHVQSAKVVRRPPPLLEVRTPIAIAIWGTMAMCNGTQQWHHVHCTLQWHPGATSNQPKWFVALPPIGSKNPYSYRYLGNNGNVQWHPAMAPRPLHPAMAPWCHVQSAKVVRRPPPYWK